MNTLIHLLRMRAGQPSYCGDFVFHGSDQLSDTTLTFAELDTSAQRIARQLRRIARRGDRVVLCYGPGLEFIRAFFGCLYAGLIAVPSELPPRSRDADRLRAIAEDARPVLMLTSRDHEPNLRNVASDLGIAVSSTDLLSNADVGEWEEETVYPDATAYLQYTSGSTASPKGVIISHGSVIANLSDIDTQFQHDRQAVSVSWLPHFHDMGLVYGILQPIYNHFRGVLLSPGAFIAQPAIWLRAISRYRATHSGGPDFAYSRCVKHVTSQDLLQLDLSSWRVAFTGAEKVRKSTLDDFAEKFHACGFSAEAFYPAYGLAEATLKVTCRGRNQPVRYRLPRGSESGASFYTSCGVPGAHTTIAIVDPNTGEAQNDGAVGEVWVNSPSVASGYWGRPEESLPAFHANIAGGERAFLRTGDLGFVESGELFITGRHKDIILLYGRNRHPEDIETVVAECHPLLRTRRCAALSMELDGKEELLILVEGSSRSSRDRELLPLIRRSLAAELQIQVRVVALVARGSLPVTSSGKLRRSACRDAWLSNGLHVIARDEINMVPRKGAIATLVEKNQMEEVLCLLIADNLGIPADAIPANIPLTQLGLDSLGAIQVSGVLDAEFGMKHSIDFLLSGATLKDVTSKLVSLPDAVEPRRRVADAKPEQLREYAASLFQLRLWNVYHMTRRRGLLNIVRAVRFDGDLDTSRLIHAVQVVTNRHGSLRTTFSQGRTEVVAKEHLSVDVNIPIVDLRDLEPERRVRAVTDLARMMSHREVNLKRAPLWSACVLVLASREAQLIWSISHLLVDAISFDLLERELSALYADAPLLGDAGSYGLFAYEQRQKREQSDARHQLQYWSNRVDRISPISWPVLPQVHGVSTSIHRDVQLSKAWRLGFEGFCRHESITPFMAFFTALTAILWRYTGQLKFVVSVPVDCRPKNQLQSVGCFANRLPLVAEIDPRLTFREYLHRVREAISEVLENRHTALIDIETTLRSYRDASALNLLSQVLLEFRERDCLPDFGAVQATSVTLDPPDLPFDLVTAVELSDPVSLTFLFRSRYFNETACAWIVNAYHHVLQRMPESLSKTMSRLEMPPLPVSHSVQKALEIDIVANFVAEGIRESLTFWMNRINCPVRLEFTSFNQIIQYLLKSGHAELVSPNIAVILIRAEAYLMPREDISEVAARLNEIAEALLIASRRTPESRFIVLFCPASPVNHEDLRLETAERQFCELVQDERGIDVIPSRTLERCYQVNSYYDPYGDRLACMPYTRLSLTSFGTMVARRIECFRRRSKKVIVVDCDDTLWSGVGGEDGMQGITIDEHRVALQAFLKQQSESGRLLCICSKNDEEDVLDVLESHPDMLLRREHFAAWRINWLPKAENLRTLAEELNLALDGFICLDDSAAECAQLREQCPEVLTLELPTDVTQIPSFLYSVWEFDFARQTDTDRERAVLYRQHSTRVQSEKAATTMDDFLAGLNLCVCIEEVDECGVRRAAQLTERTNQFNLNGIRHSEDELMNFRNDPSCRLWLVRATDRFGDYGTIGLIGCRLGESMSATTFLLSCRALGKRIEYRMALWIAEIARSLEYEAVEFAFVETRKNAAVQQFLMTMEPKPVNRHLSVRADVVIRRCDAALMPFGRDRNGGYGFNGGPDRVDEGRITA